MHNSCRDRIDAVASAIERTGDSYNAFTMLRIEDARLVADALDRLDAGQRRALALFGVPVAVKDVFDVAGLATTSGCAAYRDRLATTDAAVVSTLRAAGAIVVGKTNQHELGAGTTGLVSCFGPVRNPHDITRIAGGSSSGAGAAVAGGVVPLAIGTDTGGSIRIPASFCGITGLRPTPGRISLLGKRPMSPEYDSAGPMARTARECAAAFAALVGSTPPSWSADPVAHLRVGLPRPFFEWTQTEVRDAVIGAAAALEGLGARIEWIDGPDLDHGFAGFAHVWKDLADHHHELWDHPQVSPDVAALIDLGRRMSDARYAESKEAADVVRRQFDAALQNVDVLLTPATPCAAPRADQHIVEVDGGTIDIDRGGLARLTAPVNEAGLPAVAFPVGASAEGLPLGAQLIGRPHRDEQLLATVAAYEERPERT